MAGAFGTGTEFIQDPTDQGGGQIPKDGPVVNDGPVGGPGPGDPGLERNPGTQAIDPNNALRGRQIDWGVTASKAAGAGSAERVKSGKTVGSIKKAFEAQQPLLMQQFRQEAEGLARRTSAMGRTGSGLFNRETGYVGDRALAARESLLGNLAFTATQADANRALQAALGNQGAGVSMAGINAQIANANAARQQQTDLGAQSHLANERDYQDTLAREVMADERFKIEMARSGFGNDPTGATGVSVGAGQSGSGQYGGEAGTVNDQLGSYSEEATRGRRGGRRGAGPPPGTPVTGSGGLYLGDDPFARSV